MSVRAQKRRDPKTGAVREFWFVDIDYQHADGRRERVRKVSPVQTRRGAEQYEREVRQHLLAGSYGKEVIITREAPTLTQFLEPFLTYSENNNKASTVASKRQMLANHIVPFFGSKKLDGIGPADIESFKAVMR